MGFCFPSVADFDFYIVVVVFPAVVNSDFIAATKIRPHVQSVDWMRLVSILVVKVPVRFGGPMLLLEVASSSR